MKLLNDKNIGSHNSKDCLENFYNFDDMITTLTMAYYTSNALNMKNSFVRVVFNALHTVGTSTQFIISMSVT